MKQSIIQVDAFTDRPFGGNPAAVCVSQSPLEDALMQQIATEMNLSETAFLYALEGEGNYSLRWFTPTAEIDLCGHATLASAHVLWTEGYLATDITAKFQTKSGELLAGRRGELIQLDFPVQPVHDAPLPPTLIAAMNHADIVHGSRNDVNYLVELRSPQAVANLAPDLNKIAKLPSQGVIVTSVGNSPYDFVSRYFVPALGIPEDPVTGSSHCSLGPYWQAKLGKDKMIAYQASERSGVLHIECTPERVYISGQAVTVLRGELLL
ncbi:phenazine biosynthesis protein family [Leptolyngbya sp. Heron Island J]|uniref:PhzF family phenazine biosynthesis protein n=1 Tax=Leptolyngbya sp. Heron Island J TaxID=1385935 RepID=UPI0003B979C9|nr:PhzF family phenazine biosynthesis protein [Leptolyngbya sp. Heron Island J]ESA34543.1 phenazine biosynthesis protein family [Leptolyngbya sp. Heron Island J]